MILVVRVVQYGVEMDFLDLGDRDDVAGDRLLDLDVVLALELEQMADLEWFLAVVDQQLRIFFHRALINTKHAELADERVVDDLEHVGDDMLFWIGLGLNGHRIPRRCP